MQSCPYGLLRDDVPLIERRMNDIDASGGSIRSRGISRATSVLQRRVMRRILKPLPCRRGFVLVALRPRAR
jgi:hypothetical protein